jgi:signal peptidase II
MQAARGTSLSSTDSAESPTFSARRRYVGLFALIAAVLYAVDQVTKYLAVAHLTGEPDKPLLGELLQLNLTRNPGAAFSTGTAFTEVLTGVAIVAVGVVVWLSRRLGSRAWAVGMGLLLAGVGGNLTDRMLREPGPFRGHVIDFLMLPNWPIFNVADMCINAAAGLILIQAFRGIKLDGTRVKPDEPTTTEPDDAAR